MSRRDKHKLMSLSWSRLRIPVALGAMSLRITSALPPGSSSWIFRKVLGSVTSAGHRNVAPSRGNMWRRSTPSTKPTGALGSKEEMVKVLTHLHPEIIPQSKCNKIIKQIKGTFSSGPVVKCVLQMQGAQIRSLDGE